MWYGIAARPCAFRKCHPEITLHYTRCKFPVLAQLLWFAVTKHPTAEWLAQQIAEAFPWDTAPRYLTRD